MKLFAVLNIEMWTLLQIGTCWEKEVSLRLVDKEIGLKMALGHYEKSQEVAQLFLRLQFTLFKVLMPEQFHGRKTALQVFLTIMWFVHLTVKLRKWS